MGSINHCISVCLLSFKVLLLVRLSDVLAFPSAFCAGCDIYSVWHVFQIAKVYQVEIWVACILKTSQVILSSFFLTTLTMLYHPTIEVGMVLDGSWLEGGVRPP